jgi:hypothetical protein
MPARRELIEPTKGDKRYVRRDKGGRFDEVDDMGRSLSADRRRKARTSAGPGQGDRGDRPRAAAPGTARATSSRPGTTGARAKAKTTTKTTTKSTTKTRPKTKGTTGARAKVKARSKPKTAAARAKTTAPPATRQGRGAGKRR